jgi:DNA modification methylase
MSNITELKITYRRLAELKADPRNPRKHDRNQIRKIAESIATFGFYMPIVVDANDVIVIGHGRPLGARNVGLELVPTIRLQHLSEQQVKALRIADNRLAEISIWDERHLAEQLKELAELDLAFNIEVTGFSMGEIDLKIEGLSDPDPDESDEPGHLTPQPMVSRVGDLWRLGPHRVLCGSALDHQCYAMLMKGDQAAMVLTDPPFNVPVDGHASGLGRVQHREFVMGSGELSDEEFVHFLKTALSLLAAHTIDGSLHFVFMDWRHMEHLLAAGRSVYRELKNLCVWAKNNGGMGSLYRSQHELVFVFKHGTAPHRNNVQLGRYGRNRSNLWNYPGATSFGRSGKEGNLLALHPTVKPVALVADAILDCTSRGDIVLDAFLGSGTTVIGAERTGRRCYGLDLDPGYIDTVIRRWQSYTGEAVRHDESGKTFQEITDERKPQ